MTDLYDAVRALEERKVRALGEADDRGMADSAELRLLLVGLDVNVEQLDELAVRWAHHAAHAAVVDRVNPLAVLAGGWADGLITGLLLADMRAREPVE